MLDASTDIFTMLIVGQCGPIVAHRLETIFLIGTVVHVVFQLVEVIFLTFFEQFNKLQLILEVVENDKIFVEDVFEVGRIVQVLRLVLHVNVLEVANGIESRVAKDAAVALVFAFDVETLKEFVDQFGCVVFVCDGLACLVAIGKLHHAHAMLHRYAGNGMHADEGTAVLAIMIVGTLHQGALRIGVANPHIHADRCVQIAQYLLGCCMISKHISRV